MKTLVVALAIYTFAGGRWTDAEVEAAVSEAGRILAQCNIEVTFEKPAALAVEERYRFYSTPVSRELVRRVQPRKPALFFVDDTRNDPAYDAEAIGRGNSRMRPELADTVWIAHGARDLPQVIAHELMHVLADSGEHSDEPGNLMGVETSPHDTRLAEAQCARARDRAQANGLVTDRRATN